MVEFDEGDMYEDENFLRHFRGMNAGEPEMDDYLDYLCSESDYEVEENIADHPSNATNEDFTNNPDCPRCGSKMVKRSGPFGKFWGCSTFPQCRGTRNI